MSDGKIRDISHSLLEIRLAIQKLHEQHERMKKIVAELGTDNHPAVPAIARALAEARSAEEWVELLDRRVKNAELAKRKTTLSLKKPKK